MPVTHTDSLRAAVSEAIFAAILTTGRLPWDTTDEANRACDYIAEAAIAAMIIRATQSMRYG